ncbi:hypothetical protein Syun_009830 [Stephania yunnanensis]|uniref:Transmembrane protein n=1 Tax=Stephania yunnanensis TaxID=152371 RepID=A0AAP0KF76_9MAGN
MLNKFRLLDIFCSINESLGQRFRSGRAFNVRKNFDWKLDGEEKGRPSWSILIRLNGRCDFLFTFLGGLIFSFFLSFSLAPFFCLFFFGNSLVAFMGFLQNFVFLCFSKDPLFVDWLMMGWMGTDGSDLCLRCSWQM